MVNKFVNQPSVKEVVDKINEVVDAVNQGGGGGGGGVSDVKVNNTSVVTSGVANIDLTGYAQTSNLATVATSGSYNDLSNKPTIPDAQVQSNWTETNTSSKAYIKNKPTIPTVNNATLTIQKNGTTVKTFTANSSSNVTCNITVPTNTNELTNGAGFITGIGSADVINALGYTPYSASNPNGYTSNIGTITGIKMNGSSKGTSGVVDLGTVITAHQDISGKQDKITSTNKLSADLVQDGTTNKTVTATEKTTWNNKLDSSAISDMATKTWVGQQGYTSNIGTVTSVNNTQPDANGNVTISTGGANTDLSNLSSTGEAHFLKNIATGTNALTIGGTSSSYTGGTNIGVSSQAKQNYGTAFGFNTNANGNSSTCIGRNAGTSAASAIQIGAGVNSTANTLQVGFIHASTNYQLLDGTTGLIPDARLSSNIARTSQIPSAVTESTVSGWGFTKNVGTITGITMNGSSIGTSGVVDLGNVVRPTNLATVATTGDYNDLSNKPGQWVRKIATAFQAASVGESEYLLSNYLPSNIDNWCYSLIINLRAYCNSSSTAYPIHIYTSSFDSIDTSGAYTAQASVGGYGRQGSNTFILPVNNESSEYNPYHLSPALYMYCTSANIDSIRITIWGYKKEYKLR